MHQVGMSSRELAMDLGGVLPRSMRYCTTETRNGWIERRRMKASENATVKQQGNTDTEQMCQ